MSQNSGNITLANANSTLPMTAGSYLPVGGGPGIGGLIFGIASAGYVGQIGVAVSMDGTNFTRVLDSSITNTNDGSTGIAANATGIYTCPVGALQVFVYFVSWTSGSATITASTGNGSGIPGEKGGGSNVNATVVANALGTERTGQVVIAVTGTRVQLPSLAAVNGVLVSAGPSNSNFTSTAGSIGGTIGGSTVTDATDGTGNGYALQPGQSVGFAVANSNVLYANGVAGDAFYVSVS